MTETQERFLRAVLTRVPLDLVVEMHLFPPIRRGTLETGVAVIATALPPEPLLVVAASDDEAATASDAGWPVESHDADAITADVVDPHAAMPDTGGVPAAQTAMTETETTGDAGINTGINSEIGAGIDAGIITGISTESDAGSDAERNSDHGARTMPSVDIGEALMEIDGSGGVELPVVSSIPSPRMRIFTASYRHTIKGVDRGKWTFDVHEEADAPLAAVELVLRGVRHRSTEAADPEQVSHEAMTALVVPARVAPAA